MTRFCDFWGKNWPRSILLKSLSRIFEESEFFGIWFRKNAFLDAGKIIFMIEPYKNVSFTKSRIFKITTFTDETQKFFLKIVFNPQPQRFLSKNFLPMGGITEKEDVYPGIPNNVGPGISEHFSKFWNFTKMFLWK